MGERTKVLTLDVQAVVDALKGGAWRVVGNALPEDARVLRMGLDDVGRVNVVVESASWPEVPFGCVPEWVPSPLLRKVAVLRVDYAGDQEREPWTAAAERRGAVKRGKPERFRGRLVREPGARK